MKKIISAMLVLALFIGLVPMYAMAAETGEIPAGGGALETGEYLLTEDLAVSGAVKVAAGETVTIDLGGYTLDGTPSTGNFAVINQGTLILKNGTITKSTNKNSCGIANYGTISIENVEIDVEYIGIYAISGECSIENTQVSGGVFGAWFTGERFTATDSTIYGGSYGMDCETAGGQFVATGTEISSGWCGIYTDQGTETDIELTDCTVSGDTRAVIQWASGDFAASGTTFQTPAGNQTIEFNHGTVKLSNGTTVLEGEEPGRIMVRDGITVAADRTVVAAKSSLMSTTWQSVAADQYTAETITGFEVGEDSVTITTAEGFGWWAAHYADYSGKTVEIEEDLDLDEYLWDPMDVASGKVITINGNGHTISNLIVTGYRYKNSNGTTYYSGLIGKLNGKAAISDLIFENANVEIGGNIIGTVVGLNYGRAELTNITVQNSLVSGFGKVGGLVGQDAGGTVILNGCAVKNTIISGSSNCAGLVGLKMQNAALEIEDCTVEDLTWLKSAGTDYKCLDLALTNKCDISGDTVDMENVLEATDETVKGRFAYYDTGRVFYAAWGDLYTDYEGWCIVDGDHLSHIFVGLCHNLSDASDVHAWGDWEETIAPACEDEGEQTHVCQICGEEEHDAIEATGHTWGQGIVTIYPTTTTYGERRYDCIHCDASYTEVLARVPVETPAEPEEELEDEEVPLAGGEFALNADDHFAYIHGYADGTIRPEASLTRAETATIFYNLMTEQSKAMLETNENGFSDVTLAYWGNTQISTLNNAELLQGYTDGKFRPEQNITRAEFVTIVCRAVGVDASKHTGSTIFADVAGHWGEGDITYAYDMGWIVGYSDGSFRPDQEITRAEAIKVLNTVLGRCSDQNGQLKNINQWKDLNPGNWYYYDVLEAAVGHEFERITEGEKAEKWTKTIAE